MKKIEPLAFLSTIRFQFIDSLFSQAVALKVPAEPASILAAVSAEASPHRHPAVS